MRPNASFRAPAIVCALLFGALALACRGDAKPERRVLVVGWDGAGWELIDRLLEQGRLPNVAKLIDRGFRAELSQAEGELHRGGGLELAGIAFQTFEIFFAAVEDT